MTARSFPGIAAAVLCFGAVSVAAAPPKSTPKPESRPPLELETAPLLIIATDSPNVAGTIALRNNTTKELTPSLSVGTFRNEPFEEPVPIAAKFPAATKIGKGEAGLVPVELSNVTEPGYAHAELRSGTTILGQLRVVKKAFGFNVAPLGWDGKQPVPLQLVRDERGTLALLNSDPYTHSFVWSLHDGPRELARGRVPLLLPNETVYIDVPAEGTGWLQRLRESLQSPQSDGMLLLRATPRGAAGIGHYWTAKNIPLRLQRTTGEGADHDLWQTLLTFLLLLAGGVTSLFLTYWVPNTLRKMNLKSAIDDLHPKTQQLNRTPPTLRVLLAVQRNRLRARLDERPVMSPDFLPLATESEQQMKALQRRIELAQRIDYQLIRIEREWESGTTLGPTVLRAAAAQLEQAVAQLHQVELTEAEMRTIEGRVEQAAQSLSGVGAKQDPQATEDLVNRAKKLQAQKKELEPLAHDLRDLAPALSESDPKAVAWPTGFWMLDYAVTKMEVIAGIPADKREKVLRLLRVHSLDAFLEADRQARLIIEKSTTQEEVWKAVQEKKARVFFNPERPGQNDLVSFELKLNDPGLDASAAKRTFSCNWDFADGFHEDGWHVAHYFAKKGDYKVQATVRDQNNSEAKLDPVTVSVQKVTGRRFGPRSRVEWIRLIVALCVVLLGLLAGAKEQLAKLDFIAAVVALFLLGLTADQIKNLLAPRT